MNDITELVLNLMQEEGWYPAWSREITHTRPSAWDINCGDCERWAELAAKKYGGEVIWLDALDDQSLRNELESMGGSTNHAVLFLNNLWYDSQDADGVSDPRLLQVVRGISRHEFLSL